MAVLRLVGKIAATVSCASVAALTPAGVLTAPAAASMTPGMAVWVVKDQAGGAFYNVSTGTRFALVAATAVPTLGIVGVQVADGVVLTADGQLLEPLSMLSAGTPAESVVQVTATTGVGGWEDAATGTQYELVDARDTVLPGRYDWALRTAKNTILTINRTVLVPVQAATGLEP